MRTFTTITAPATWASALVNGDYSGLQDEESLLDLVYLYRFLRREAPWVIVDVKRDKDGEAKEPYFSWSYGTHGGTHAGGMLTEYVASSPAITTKGDAQRARAREELKKALARRREAKRLETAR